MDAWPGERAPKRIEIFLWKEICQVSRVRRLSVGTLEIHEGTLGVFDRVAWCIQVYVSAPFGSRRRAVETRS